MMLGPFPKPLSALSNALCPATDHVGRPCRGCCRSGWHSTLRSPCPFQSREKVIKWCGVGVGVATGSRVMGSGPKRTRVKGCAKGKKTVNLDGRRQQRSGRAGTVFVWEARIVSDDLRRICNARASNCSCAVNGKWKDEDASPPASQPSLSTLSTSHHPLGVTGELGGPTLKWTKGTSATFVPSSIELLNSVNWQRPAGIKFCVPSSSCCCLARGGVPRH
jgi:hypothetical protein